MGTGYTRNDTSNNIANGNVIDADDLDGEFNAIESAFNASTGHTHDGTSAEGAPIEVTGPNQEYLSDATALYPKTDDTYDLGKTGAEWKDLYIDGTANIDSLVADTADINGGTIDGATIGGSSAGAGTFTDVTASGTVNLTGATVSDGGSVTTVDINGGTIDGTVIGGSTPAAISGTTGQFDTSLNVDGTITSDGLVLSGNVTMSSALPVINLFDSDGTNQQTQIIQAGGGTYIDVRNNTNHGSFLVRSNDGGGLETRFQIAAGGDISFYEDTGTTPKFFWDASAERLGIGTSSPGATLDVAGNVQSNGRVILTNTGSSADTSFVSVGTLSGSFYANTPSGKAIYHAVAGAVITYSDANLHWFKTAGSERMRIDSSGNLLIAGTGTPTSSAGNLVLYNGTAPTGNATDGVILYAEDVSSSSELKVRDEAGNVTTLSPHNFDLIPEGPSEDMAWSYYSERDGKRINVDMLKAIRLLEQISGEKLVHIV